MGKNLDELVREYPDTVIIRLAGGFYNAYDDSARVLSIVTGYKIKKATMKAMPKCGFPADDTLMKVTRLMDAERVNYVVFDKREKVMGNIFPDNYYKKLLGTFDERQIVFPDGEEKVIQTVYQSGETVNDESKKVGEDRVISITCSEVLYDRLTVLAGAMGDSSWDSRTMNSAITLALNTGLKTLGY